MVDRFLAFGVTGYHPHVLKSFVQILGVRIADLDKTGYLVFANVLQVIGSSPIATSDVAFDNQGSGAFPHDKAVRMALWVCSMDRLMMANKLVPSASEDLPLFR